MWFHLWLFLFHFAHERNDLRYKVKHEDSSSKPITKLHCIISQKIDSSWIEILPCLSCLSTYDKSRILDSISVKFDIGEFYQNLATDSNFCYDQITTTDILYENLLCISVCISSITGYIFIRVKTILNRTCRIYLRI